MLLITIAGSTGTGKSTMAKKIVNASKQVFIFDRQDEYDDIPYYEGKILPRMRFFGSFDEFIDILSTLRGYTVIAEEATGIFSGRAGKSFIDIVLSKRHTNNTFVLVFHSIYRVPLNLYEFTDQFIIHKTNDQPDMVKKKYPNLLRAFMDVNRMQDKHAKKIVRLTQL